MDPISWNENVAPTWKDRFKHIICVIVQVHKLEGSSWRELTKDFVLLHMYFDVVDQEVKLIALDGVKLVVKGFVLSSNIQLVRPTKKFVHFVSTLRGRSEMYGFGFQQLNEVEQFLRQFSIINRRLHASSGAAIQMGPMKRHFSLSSTCSLPTCSSATSTPIKSTDAMSLFSPADSPWPEPVPPPGSDGGNSLRHIEKELQRLSCTAESFATAPKFSSVPSPSRQTSMDMQSNLQYAAAAAAAISNEPVHYKADELVYPGPSSGPIAHSSPQRPYQLWDTPPWSRQMKQAAAQSTPDLTETNSNSTRTSIWDAFFAPIGQYSQI